MRAAAASFLAIILAFQPLTAQTPTSPVPVTAPAKRPAADFAKLPFLANPKLSPDGTRVLTKLAVNGEAVLAIVPVDAADKPVLIGLGENDLISWQWVNKDWAVARIGDEALFEDVTAYATRVVAISADGKTVKRLAARDPGQSAEVIWTANDGTPRVLIAKQKSLYLGLDFWPAVVEVDVETGKEKRAADSVTGVFDWYADIDGTVRVGTGYDDRTQASRTLYRPDAKSQFTIISNTAKDGAETAMRPATFPKDGSSPIAFSDHEGYWGLYELDFATMKPGKASFSVAGYDVDSFVRHPKTGEVLGVSLTTNRPRKQWLDPKLLAIQTSVEKTLGDGLYATIESYDVELNNFLLYVGGGARAGAYYVYRSDSGKLTRLALLNDALGMARLGAVSTVKFKARDGMAMSGVLTLPPGRQGKNLPLVLMPHGGPIGVRDSEEFDWWTQFLADRGYAVFQPNYRGSGGYGRAFEKAGDGEWGMKMQDDLNDAVDHLVATGVVDPKRVCIAGASYGGYAAMRAAQRDGARYRCAISYAGVSDLQALKSTNGRSFLYGNSLRSYFNARATDMKSVSPINFPEQFSTPILIMHGAKDKRVAIAQSKRMADKLSSIGKDMIYIEQPKADHFFSRAEDRLQFLEESERFLTKHNPAN
jgi:dipeptidyl aminopeptidase/acylaminoacyl peptidase